MLTGRRSSVACMDFTRPVFTPSHPLYRCILARSRLRSLGRFSNPGDTVLGIGVESAQVPEVTLSRGRRVEMVLSDNNQREEVEGRIETAFALAFSEGKFQVLRAHAVFP